MKKFMFFIKEDLAAVQQMTEQEMQADIQAHIEWVEKLTKEGSFVQGDPLESSGVLISKEKIMTDGPFIEGKEGISGYFIIKARDLETAVKIAQGCPSLQNGTSLEIRPIMVFE